MFSKIAVTILVLVSLALGVTLMSTHRHHTRERQEREARIRAQSKALEELERVSTISHAPSPSRSEPETLLAPIQAPDKQRLRAQDEVAIQENETAQDRKIHELETNRALLKKRVDQLTDLIAQVETENAALSKSLIASQGEKDSLARELAQLRAEKAELEQRQDALAYMQGQVSRLKEEAAIARRLEFMSLHLTAVTAKGGAQGLMTPPARPLAGAIRSDFLAQLPPKGARTVPPLFR